MTTGMPNGLLRLMWKDLLGSSHMRSLWVFCASLMLGITLVAACSNLLQLVQEGLQNQQKEVFGGDLQISQREAISSDQLSWIQQNGSVSRLLELRTMLGTLEGDFTVVELQSVDEHYPLYGEVKLHPEIALIDAVKQNDNGIWGAVFDPLLAEQLDLTIGQTVLVGALELELRAVIEKQPDRSFRADVRGPPVIIDERALNESGLLLPTSLVDYEYRIRTNVSPSTWRQNLQIRFPDATWEVQTIDERSDAIAERLEQVASVLLLIGFSTLFIGGLGVVNSIGAYLKTKYRTLATLQSIGCRDKQISAVFIGQVLILGFLASTAGALIGACLAYLTAQYLSEQIPITVTVTALLWPTGSAILFGVITALLFALPILGRTIITPTAQLIKGSSQLSKSLPSAYRSLMIVCSIVLVTLLLILIPEPLIALSFLLTIGLLFFLLHIIVAWVKKLATVIAKKPQLDGKVTLRLATASVAREDSALRPLLLSLGLSLTLLVAATVVVNMTIASLYDTVPARAPALVFYDLQADQVDDFNQLATSLDAVEEIAITPLVLGRLTQVNNESLQNSDIAQRALEANDEHKLSYRTPGIDNVSLVEGEWWPANYEGTPLVAMEDREASQLGLKVGDKLVFTIMGQSVEADLAAIYSQARFETSFWLEAVFTRSSLDPFITRSIGSLYVEADNDVQVMSELAAQFPNVVIIRTAKAIEAARSILAGASLGIFAIAIISLSASILVMASVVAVSRQLQVYNASVMYAIGAKRRLIVGAVVLEYGLLAVILSIFAGVLGTLIGWSINDLWLKLGSADGYMIGLAIAAVGSIVCLMAGAWWLLSSLAGNPAMLLRQQAN